jgi:hypothetical protein
MAYTGGVLREFKGTIQAIKLTEYPGEYSGEYSNAP